jgi:hypothetical protein
MESRPDEPSRGLKFVYSCGICQVQAGLYIGPATTNIRSEIFHCVTTMHTNIHAGSEFDLWSPKLWIADRLNLLPHVGCESSGSMEFSVDPGLTYGHATL